MPKHKAIGKALDASRLHPTAHSPRGGGPGLAALLLGHMRPAYSVVAPGADFTSAWLSNSRSP